MRKEAQIRGHRIVFKTWTYGEKQKALQRITEFIKDPKTEKTTAKVDPFKLNDQMLLATIVEWDLVKDGKPLPITLESIHDLEPPELVEDMIDFTQTLNGVTDDERKK